jgi:hypothetical protein
VDFASAQELWAIQRAHAQVCARQSFQRLNTSFARLFQQELPRRRCFIAASRVAIFLQNRPREPADDFAFLVSGHPVLALTASDHHTPVFLEKGSIFFIF